jgi:hypothetical protein
MIAVNPALATATLITGASNQLATAPAQPGQQQTQPQAKPQDEARTD